MTDKQEKLRTEVWQIIKLIDDALVNNGTSISCIAAFGALAEIYVRLAIKCENEKSIKPGASLVFLKEAQNALRAKAPSLIPLYRREDINSSQQTVNAAGEALRADINEIIDGVFPGAVITVLSNLLVDACCRPDVPEEFARTTMAIVDAALFAYFCSEEPESANRPSSVLH